VPLAQAPIGQIVGSAMEGTFAGCNCHLAAEHVLPVSDRRPIGKARRQVRDSVRARVETSALNDANPSRTEFSETTPSPLGHPPASRASYKIAAPVETERCGWLYQFPYRSELSAESWGRWELILGVVHVSRRPERPPVAGRPWRHQSLLLTFYF
jgi:hypothetical protein